MTGITNRGNEYDTRALDSAEAEAIDSLRAESAEAGDDEQVALCDRALQGDAEAIAECLRAIDDGAEED
jgi:hypothetical protein